MGDLGKNAAEKLRDYMETHYLGDEPQFQELREALALVPDFSQCSLEIISYAQYFAREVAYCTSDEGTPRSREKSQNGLKYRATSVRDAIYRQLFINPDTHKRYSLVEPVYDDPVFSFARNVDISNAGYAFGKITFPKSSINPEYESILQEIFDYVSDIIYRENKEWITHISYKLNSYIFKFLSLFDIDENTSDFVVEYKKVIDEGITALRFLIGDTRNDIRFLKIEEDWDNLRETFHPNTSMKEARQTTNEIKKMKGEAEDTLQAIQTVAGLSGTAKFGELYEKAANTHRKAAQRWLIGVCGFFVAILVMLTVIFLSPGPFALFAQEPSSLHYLSLKILFFFALFYGLFWCGRMFRSEKQMQTVYTQKSYALITYNAFIRAARGTDAETGIRLIAARSVFLSYNCGYIGGNETAVESSAFPDIGKRLSPGKAD